MKKCPDCKVCYLEEKTKFEGDPDEPRGGLLAISYYYCHYCKQEYEIEDLEEKDD